MQPKLSKQSEVGNIVVGKPTTYPQQLYYYQCDFPEHIHTHHFKWCPLSNNRRSYFLDAISDNFKVRLNIEPICRLTHTDLKEITDVYVCRSFKYDVYILVMDDVITLTRHMPIFTANDYDVHKFDIDAFIAHRDIICEAFTALSFSPVEFIMLTGINHNTQTIPLYKRVCIDTAKSVILGEEIGYKNSVGEDAYDEPKLSFFSYF